MPSPALYSGGSNGHLLALHERAVPAKLAVDYEPDGLVRHRAEQGDFCVLRVSLLVIAMSMLVGASAVAADPMAPNDIKATFFTGQPFTAASPSGAKFKMTFTPDGKMTREPLEQSGNASAGTWKLSAKGFCTAWGHAKAFVSQLFRAEKINGQFKKSQLPSQLRLQFGRNDF